MMLRGHETRPGLDLIPGKTLQTFCSLPGREHGSAKGRGLPLWCSVTDTTWGAVRDSSNF